MENKQDKFTFYQPYWDLVKDEDGATVKSIIEHLCRYMLDGNEEKPTDKTQALIWEDLVEVLAPQREKELQGKTPKAYNSRWKHFTFRRNYYNKMLSLEDGQAKEYLQAICELAFNGKQPKELSATVKKYYELTLLTLNTSIKRKKAGSYVDTYVNALGHNYDSKVTAPTCTEQGYTTHTCSCGDSYVDSYVNALGHNFTNYVSDGNATYEQDGTKTAVCDREGCNVTNTITDEGSKLKSGISFKTLSVTGTNVYGKVGNTTETFSFINEVTAVGTAKYVVALDIYGSQQVATKTIPLSIGDNTVYIIETIDGEPTSVYTVTVRRRPMYEVTFNTTGGSAVESQTVEEDSLASQPTTKPTRTGYTFSSWDYDFAKPITQDTTITASWTANTNTSYKVEYYLQNLEDDNYTLETTENKTGTTGTTANAEIKTFEHFTYVQSETDSGNIAPDGSTVLKVYYTRDTYTVTFDGNGGTLIDGTEIQTVKYGGSVTAPTYERIGYTFSGYDKTNYTNISESFTVTATWTINQYTLTIVYDNGQDNRVITQDYNTSIESIANPERVGYDFAGWDKELPTAMPAGDITVTAKWNAIFTISGSVVTGLTGYGKANYSELNIPSQIDGTTITSIGSSAFYSCSKLTSITIPDSVTSIGYRAFSGCSSLESITLPFVGAKAGVTSSDTYQYPLGYIFGTSSYTGSTATKQYYYGSSTSSTTYDTYYIPSALKNVTITDGNILYGAFYNCSNLTSITIPDSVTSIGNYAFEYCSSLTSITIPDSVTSISNYAFEYCSSLTSITIPDSVTSIGSYAFSVCSSLKSVTIGNSVTSIGFYAFRNCSSLTSITIPDSVTSIGSRAFSKCSSLTSVTIGNSVTSIGDYAFSVCSSLTSITIPDSVIRIGSFAFYDCSSLTSVYITDIAAWCNISFGSNDANPLYYAHNLYLNNQLVTELVIPDGVTSIGNYAFYDCSSLTSVTIGNSVTSIGNYAFYDCSSLTSVTIGNSVTSIGEYAFV